ncbi:MBL fold metallo-hydrolase [Candidatus Bipolaricaulota bacterium]|nr:MBL fold metallo-hydrolase [Candidatus Bipolaricaulota bacterium]
MTNERVLILYDNRSDRSDLQPGWGFSALIEFNGHQVLFDTGADNLVLEHNATALGVNLAIIDTLVLSHEHCDHIGAITSALHKNLDVFYPASFSVLFQGEVEERPERALWRAHPVSLATEIVPGITSTGELGKEIVEQALIIRGSAGPILITGCAHPGIVEIARVATDLARESLHLVLGGFHLYKKTEPEVEEIASALKRLGVKRIAPCHCTGMAAMKTLQNAFADAGVEVKVGTEIVL